MKLQHYSYDLKFRHPFTISKGTKTHQPTLIVSLEHLGHIGYGEAPAITYYDITVEKNITTIINTHDMNSVMEIGDNIALIHEGKLAWSGNKEEVLTSRNEILQGFVFASPFLQKVRDLHVDE